MRKITVDVDAKVLDAAMAEGTGIAETVREALTQLARRRAYQRLLKMEGQVQFEQSWQELRGKDEDD